MLGSHRNASRKISVDFGKLHNSDMSMTVKKLTFSFSSLLLHSEMTTYHGPTNSKSRKANHLCPTNIFYLPSIRSRTFLLSIDAEAFSTLLTSTVYYPMRIRVLMAGLRARSILLGLTDRNVGMNYLLVGFIWGKTDELLEFSKSMCIQFTELLLVWYEVTSLNEEFPIS